MPDWGAKVFEARYAGTCKGCFEYVEIGDECAYDDDELVHADCHTGVVDRGW